MYAEIVEARSARSTLARESRTDRVVAPVRFGKLSAAFDTAGCRMTSPRNAEIYGEGELARSLYKVVGGTVRTCKLLVDGRRQISSFYQAGDVFGLNAGDKHEFSAEAVTTAIVTALERKTLAKLAVRDGELASELWGLTAAELDHMRKLMVTLGRKSAHERLATFLLEMADRTHSEDMLDLPMSRQDIADYLGLTIETVSRTFTQLEADSTIELPSCRRVVVRDYGALARLSG